MLPQVKGSVARSVLSHFAFRRLAGTPGHVLGPIEAPRAAGTRPARPTGCVFGPVEATTARRSTCGAAPHVLAIVEGTGRPRPAGTARRRPPLVVPGLGEFVAVLCRGFLALDGHALVAGGAEVQGADRVRGTLDGSEATCTDIGPRRVKARPTPLPLRVAHSSQHGRYLPPSSCHCRSWRGSQSGPC